MRRLSLTLGFVLALAGLSAATGQQAGKTEPAAKSSGSGWQLPPDAEDTKNPLTVDAKLLATGKSIFKDKCQKCHGPSGKGDGPDADPDAQENMDLTSARRGARNPEGVMFYKAWNGRKKPKMPAFKEQLTKEQVWAVVAYAQSLRKTSTP